MYYNTNEEMGDELHASWAQTAKQDELIYSIFASDLMNFNGGLTPEAVHNTCIEFYDKMWPITSIRRAINTLTKSGKLTKTNEFRISEYGKKTHIWKINTELNNN